MIEMCGRKCILIGLLVLIAIVQSDGNTQTEELIVKTNSGLVKGIIVNSSNGKSVHAYLGIPYATVTKRFGAPEDPPSWSGTFLADRLPKSCMQGKFDYALDPKLIFWEDGSPDSEDCLMLNIWLPRPRQDNLPVLVFIHGGAFQTGASNLELYNGGTLASEEEIIVVTLNYRLNAFGFLYLNHKDVSGNAGLKDQLAALTWLHNNIAQFGGDPSRITLSGESAGGSSVGLHMLLNSNTGLFHRAIIQSGSGINSDFDWKSKSESLKAAFDLTSRLKCGDENTKNVDEVVNCLEQKSAADIQSAVKNMSSDTLHFIPVFDGKIISSNPVVLLKQKNFSNRIEVMVGSTAADGAMLLQLYFPDKEWNDDTSYTSRDMEEVVRQRTGSDDSLIIKSVMFNYIDWDDRDNPEKIRSHLIQMVTDPFVCENNLWANNLANNGNFVYKYIFSHKSAKSSLPKWTGSLHGDELPYVFGRPLEETDKLDKKDELFSRTLMRYWSNFVKHGNPSGDGKVAFRWPRYTVTKKRSLQLRPRLSINHGDRLQECAFWEHMYPEIQAYVKSKNSSKKCI